jgi:hypothetical protein
VVNDPFSEIFSRLFDQISVSEAKAFKTSLLKIPDCLKSGISDLTRDVIGLQAD